MLFVDEILEVELPRKIVARKYLSPEEPCFKGHFPELPIFPGVLLIEAMAQTAAALSTIANQGADSRVPVLASVESARFSRPVSADQTLVMTVTREAQWGEFWRLSGFITVDDTRVAEARFLAARVKASKVFSRPNSQEIPINATSKNLVEVTDARTS